MSRGNRTVGEAGLPAAFSLVENQLDRLPFVNVKDYGAVGTSLRFGGASMTAGSAVLTSSLLAPAGLTASAVAPDLGDESGRGTGPAGTYTYSIASVAEHGGESLPSSSVTATTVTNGFVQLSWTRVPGAVGYRIYGRTGGTMLALTAVDATVTSWADANPNTSNGTTAPASSSGAGPFTAAMVGRSVIVQSAGAAGTAPLTATIASYQSPTQVTLAGTASASVSGTVGAVYTDDSAALLAALAATAPGGTCQLPPGTYALVGTLLLDKLARIKIRGDRATLLAIGDSGNDVLVLNNAVDVVLEGLRVLAATASAGRTSGGHLIKVVGCSQVVVRGCLLRDSTSTSLWVQRSSHVRVLDNTVIGGLADGIHVAGACADVLVAGNQCVDTGDDALACVSSVIDGLPSRRVTFLGNGVLRSDARGIAVVGGVQIKVAGNHVDSTRAAGIIVQQDAAFGTFGCKNVTVEGNTVVRGAAFTQTANALVDHGAIFTSGGSAAYPLTGISILDNSVAAARSASIRINGYVTDSAVRGNQLNAAGYSGRLTVSALDFDGSTMSNVVVEDNAISYAMTNGIYVGAATNCTVRNNRIWQPSQAGGSSTGVRVTAGVSGLLQYGNDVIAGPALSALVLQPTTAAAGAGAGTSPPAPVLTAATDEQGTVTFGSGSAPAAGVMLRVTFYNPRNNTPKVNLTATNAATAGKQPYLATVTSSYFEVGFATAATASQANTVYGISYTTAL